MAGTVDILTRAVAGMQPNADQLEFEPRLPEKLRALRFHLRHRVQHVAVSLEHDRPRLATRTCHTASEIQVNVAGHVIRLTGGEERDVQLQEVPSARAEAES